MSTSLRSVRGVRLAATLCTLLFLAACASTSNTAGGAGGLGGAGGAAVPGSSQDFVVNVGDRVFFEEDQSDLTAQAQSTLSKQAQWLRAYPQY